MDTIITPIGNFLIHCVAWLDALPDGIRALLCALLLVPLLRYFEQQIESNETRFAEAFRKTTLLALLFIPLLVWLFPSWRMVVYTPELPQLNAPTPVMWSALLGLWASGVVVCVAFLVRSYVQQRGGAFAGAAPAEDDSLTNRLAHWGRRLGLAGQRSLSFVRGPRPLHDSWRQGFRNARIGLPKAAAHFPASVQDQLIIQELCHLKKGHQGWHAFGQFVSCLYWPFTWVQALHQRLLTNLNLSADELAASCYRDTMGYNRACKQVQERLAPPLRRKKAQTTEEAPAGYMQNAKRAVTGYGAEMLQLRQPDPFLQWNLHELSSAREEVTQDERYTDPYTRVILAVGQAAFLAFLLTGTTLLPTPPEIDPNEVRWQYRWMEGFHRTMEQNDAASAHNPAAAAQLRRQETVTTTRTMTLTKPTPIPKPTAPPER